jgi:hypothetical protein
MINADVSPKLLVRYHTCVDQCSHGQIELFFLCWVVGLDNMGLINPANSRWGMNEEAISNKA